MGKDRCSNDGTTPICRCRVMYLGSSVPHATKDGLQGIQEPLRDLYPESGLVDYGSAGIDSWISVWSNGILIENVDDSGREMKRFFPIESLHYCAAVRYVVIPSISGHGGGTVTNNQSSNGVSVTSPNSSSSQQQSSSSSVLNPSGQHNGTNGANHINNSPSGLTNGDGDKNYDKVAKFLPLDSPFLRGADNGHPPLFACILRRTTGIKVLECHAFICKREPAANALVRCCFHAYADSMYAKQIEENPYSHIGSGVGPSNGSQLTAKRSRSISALDTVDKADGNWNDSSSRDLLDDLPPPPPPPHHHVGTNGHHHHHPAPSEIGAGSTVSQSPDEDNYKVTWPPGGPPPLSSGHYIREGPINTMRPGMVGKPRPMIIHMGPPPPGGGGPPPPLHPAMMPGNHPPFGIPIPLSDHPHADKILKHSLKKKKKKSKSKMLLNGSSLLIGPGSGPFPVPVNFVQVPQLSPQGSGHHHLIHPPPPPPHHQQHPHHPHNTIYGPLPIPPPPSGALPPPPPGSTAYSVRTRLRRGHSSGGGPPPPPGDYPIMFTGPGDEPIYIPPMRPLTPLSNYHGGNPHHHPHHHHHHHQPNESHYVSYPVTYGTTPRRDRYRSKDRMNGVSRSVLGSSSGVESGPGGGHNGNHGGNSGGTTGEDETERDSSPSAVGLYKRKGHLNERAFSYSIRQEHRSRSNSLANLAIDDSIPVGRPINGSAGGSGSSGGERGDEDHLHDNLHSHHPHHHPLHHHHHNNHSSHHSSSARHHHDSRRGSSSAFGDRERERSSAHSSGHFDRSQSYHQHHPNSHHHQHHHHHHHGSTNGNNYGGSRDSFIDYRESGREMSLSASMANLNVNGHSSLESKNVPKTASIKRSSKQRNSLGSKGMPIAPPLPPPTSALLMNGKSESKSMRKL